MAKKGKHGGKQRKTENERTLDELGQIGGVLALDGDSDDGRDGELHDAQVVGVLERGDRARLDQVRVDSDQTARVTWKHKE